MGLLNSSLQIGRSAILTYQSALQTVGSNVASAGSPDYTRLTPLLDPLPGQAISGGLQPGAGVALTGIQRNIDEALENRIRAAIGLAESGVTQRDSLGRIEAFLDDISGAGVDTSLRGFFDSFDNLQNAPEDRATRDLALNAAAQLAESLQRLRRQFSAVGEDLDGQISDMVGSANSMAEKIARVNEEITTAEAGRGGQATGLRDQRDALLRDLSELFDVTVREQPDGAINVYIGSETLIQANFVRELVAEQELDGEFSRSIVRFTDTTGPVDARGGRLQGLMVSRDEYGYGQVSTVDRLARAVIFEVNRAHADGQGVVGYRSLTGSNGLLGADLPLDGAAAGLAFPPRSGSFFLTVADDATGTPIAHRIEVAFDDPGAETTLESLTTAINDQVEGVTASISPGNRLTITADDGFTFSFGHDGQVAREDTSNVLAALGLNTLYTGTDARDIAVNNTLIEQPLLLAAASTDHVGDGVNAGRLASLETAVSTQLGESSIREFYNSILSSVAVASAAAQDDAAAASSILSSMSAQKESISGVSLDEEAISLLKFQRSFQGVARFISVVDGLIGELVSLIR